MNTLVKQTELTVQKIRHPLKARQLEVCRVTPLTPSRVRITLTGEDLDDFMSASFDDHVKVFFPSSPGAKPVLPIIGPSGPTFPEGERPAARDYTPRRYDGATRELDIDFVLHGSGPAATWAAQATVGQYLGIAGPRGSFVIPHGFDWHLLIGDESALPAIGRRLEELPEGKRVLAVIEVANPDVEPLLETNTDLSIRWVHGPVASTDGVSALERAVRELQLPDGEGYVWAAGEFSAIRGIRQYLVQEQGLDKSRIRAASYWRRGDSAAHQTFED
ncbi:NADPH-dependent ferric siderophore reductase [Pollutimonas subterranea]|uniref:NADPH-dependent ferric siderophore reductase n=1 Tax=Pollutimonas subterranea TaxID=2045210 RepID=A0A2N4U6Z7_9BURK|nr:siderophore-interacting protein [Pollutimonas subterranea]PLC50788.1 NADPH-dependent ferric siderophore reductase [Pollutimonas subterranea]